MGELIPMRPINEIITIAMDNAKMTASEKIAMLEAVKYDILEELNNEGDQA